MSEERLGELATSLVDFCNALESSVVKLRRQLKSLTETEPRARISEERFNLLKWENEKGARLGYFQVAYAKPNLTDKWHHCFNLLKVNNSLISNPLKEEGYVYACIYPEEYSDRIFRKRLRGGNG